MTTDRFQGDPYIQITENGAEMSFTGGQPVMDPGLENQGNMSLFTAPGWWGNVIEDDPNKKIGSDFEVVSLEPITRDMLIRLRKSAIKSLESPAFKNIDSAIEDLGHNRINIINTVTPPSGNEQQLLLTKNGQNWVNQKNDPAHLK